MNLIFSCTCFSSAEAFLVKDGRQFQVGSISDRYGYEPYGFFTEHYVAQGRFGLTANDVPTAEAVLAEYKKQCEKRGVWINKGIHLAG